MPTLSLASVKDSDPGNAGFPYQLGIFHILPFYFSYLCLLSLASVKDSDPGNAGFPYQLGILHILPFYFSYLCLLYLASVKDIRPWYHGISIPDRNPSYPAFLLFLTLSHSGKGPCIRHTKVRWEVGSRYINPIQPYSFSRQLYLCYQDRLCTIIQFEYRIVRAVIWFPCCGPGWLDGFEARILCHNIQYGEKKHNWCQALVGEAGRSIIKKLPRTATWDEVKQELCDVLGEADPKERAIEGLLQYKPKGKGLGEIAADITTKASRATDDVAMQAKLGLKAFFKAIPESIGLKLRRKHFQSVREALQEARFLQTVQDNEDLEKGKVLTEAKEEEKHKENRVDLEQVVGECLEQLQAQANLGGKNERPGNAVRGKFRCWCCDEEGHFLRQCPTVKSYNELQ